MAEITNIPSIAESQDVDTIHEKLEQYNERAKDEIDVDTDVQQSPTSEQTPTAIDNQLYVIPADESAEKVECKTSVYPDDGSAVVVQPNPNEEELDEAPEQGSQEPSIASTDMAGEESCAVVGQASDSSAEEAMEANLIDPSKADYYKSDFQKNAEDFEGLRNLPYIDLFSQKSAAQKNIDDLKSSKAMMDQVGDISSEKYSAMVGQMNVAQQKKFAASVKDFYNNYDNLLHEAKRVRNLLEKMLKAFDQQVCASTTFISQSMVESGEARRIAMLAAEDKPQNQSLIIKRLDTTINAYRDRTNFDVLFNKLRYPNNVLAIYKQFVKDPAESMKYVDKIFMPVFNDEHMTKFRQAFFHTCLIKQLEGANSNIMEVMTFFMTYWLANVYEKEYATGKCTYVKTFIMNIYDCDPSSGIYDLKGGTIYMADLGYTIYMILTIITGGQFTEKELHKKVVPVVDDMLRNLQVEFKSLLVEFPGKELSSGTSMAAMMPEMTVHALPELSVDENVQPDPVDESDSEPGDELDSCDETEGSGNSEIEDAADNQSASIPTAYINDVTPVKPSGVAN